MRAFRESGSRPRQRQGIELPDTMPGRSQLLQEIRSILQSPAVRERAVTERRQWAMEHRNDIIEGSEQCVEVLSSWAKDFLDIDVTADFNSEGNPFYEQHKTKASAQESGAQSAKLFVENYAFKGVQYELLHEICHALVARIDEIGKANFDLDDLEQNQRPEWLHREKEARLLEMILLIQAGHTFRKERVLDSINTLDEFDDSHFSLDFPGNKELIAILRSSADTLFYHITSY